MSADNGIYILETIGPEYRVAHLQAIDNLEYDDSMPELEHCPNSHTWTDNHNPAECKLCRKYAEKFNSQNPDVHIKNARMMWKNCHVFTAEEEAMKAAMEMLKDCCVCEYGICYIKIDRKF